MKNHLSNQIIHWYKKNARKLPWRQTTDPYKIWLSEIILQQTRVAQGLPYYLRFVEQYPSIRTLAIANEEDILHLWQGLGYYSRARNMHLCAKKIVNEHGGKFPKSAKALKKLPGIGEYTSAAIASFAFNERIAAIDGNLIRVISRIFGIYDTPYTKESNSAIAKVSKTLIEEVDPATYNQSMMEFGAILCTPKKPNCEICPVNSHCHALANKAVAQLPSPKKKTKISHRYFYYLIIKYGEKTYLQKRTEQDIWKNLYEFPLIETKEAIQTDELIAMINLFLENRNFTIEKISEAIKHILTHRIINTQFIHLEINTPIKNKNLLEVNNLTINEYAFPTLISRYLSS